MTKRLILILFLILLSGCERSPIYEGYFKADLRLNINGAEFVGELTQDKITVRSIDLHDVLVYKDGSLVTEGFGIEYEPKGNSAFALSGLVDEILQNGEFNGVYGGIPYTCGEGSDKVFRIVWGNIRAEIYFNKQGS